MKRQLFYVILAYAAWLTYQDINNAQPKGRAEGSNTSLREFVASALGDGKSVADYRDEPGSDKCVANECEANSQNHH